jgi:hypothetical protein
MVGRACSSSIVASQPARAICLSGVSIRLQATIPRENGMANARPTPHLLRIILPYDCVLSPFLYKTFLFRAFPNNCS